MSATTKVSMAVIRASNNDFSVGDKVKWTSHGSHWTHAKTGTVVAVIPANRVATSQHLLKKISDELGYKFDRCSLGYGPPRKHQSYLVIGDDKHKGMFKIFWPRVNSLKRV